MCGCEQARLKLASPYAREYAPDGLASPPLRSAASAGAERGGVAGRASMSDAGVDAALEPAQGAGGCSMSRRPATAVRPPAAAHRRRLSPNVSTRFPCPHAACQGEALSAVCWQRAGRALPSCAFEQRRQCRPRTHCLPHGCAAVCPPAAALTLTALLLSAALSRAAQSSAAGPQPRPPDALHKQAAPARPLVRCRDCTPSLHARSALWPHRQRVQRSHQLAGCSSRKCLSAHRADTPRI